LQKIARAYSSLKRPATSDDNSVLGGEVVVPQISKISSFFSQKKKVKGLPPPDQMRLCGNAVDPSAVTRVSVAIADFVHSHCLPFSLATDPKLMKVIEEARSLGSGYTPPNRNQMSGPLLDRLYEASWNEQMKTILCEARIFGVSVFGDGATIKSVPLVNVLAAGVNNPFALLDIHDCTAHMASGGKKDAKYIAEVVQPMITKMESEVDVNRVQNKGIVDMVFFDGASNVQNAGIILQAYNPRITVCHGAEHVVSLLFSDVYQKVMQYHTLSNFCKQCRNIWGSVRHTPSAIFKHHTKLHNNGRHIGFIKPSECRMAGEHIALLRLLRLKDALRSTITSKEFVDLRVFPKQCAILMSDDFWKYLFVMCRALYAPMRVLRLADQKTPAMDKLYYFVLQTDRMLPLWLDDAEQKEESILTSEVLACMSGNTLPAGNEEEEELSDDDDLDDDVSSMTAGEDDSPDGDVDDDSVDDDDDDDDDGGNGCQRQG
jgi:hypothetical protein